MDPSVKVDDIIFTPDEAAQLALAEIRRTSERVEEDGVQFGISKLDDYLLPFMPGDLVTVIARPSNAKTALAQYLARTIAQKILDREDETRFVAYVTWEQAIEDVLLFKLAAAAGIDASDIRRGAVKDLAPLIQVSLELGSLPLFLFGHSTSRRRKRPTLSLTHVAQALRKVDDGIIGSPPVSKKPALIVIDYLQRIRRDPNIFSDYGSRTSSSRREFMMETVDRCKDMALSFGCPVLLLCQAGRQVDDRKIKLPSMADGQETSNIEQSSDVVLTLWYPKMTEMPGDTVEIGSLKAEVTPELLLLAVAKQKFGPSGAVFPLIFKPGRNLIAFNHYPQPPPLSRRS